MNGRPRVLIAGAGIAGLEALLALRAMLGPGPEIVVLAPGEHFGFRQLAVSEPFGYAEQQRFDLGGLIAAAGGRHHRDGLVAVDHLDRSVLTRAGETIGYDRLLVAPGATPVAGLPGPGVITYRGPDSNTEIREALLSAAEEGGGGLAFVCPATVHWSLPLYELALLGSEFLGSRAAGAGLQLVTAEARPMAPFGAATGTRIAALLEAAGIELRVGLAPARMRDGALAMVDGSEIPCRRAVSMPRYEVAMIRGLPQDHNGFIDTDPLMRVHARENVWAAGDATWFPLKQGGIAAQQADVAAAAIARSLGAEVDVAPFRPILRAALLTGSGPVFMRAGLDDPEHGEISDAPLWWPPAKVAGRYLAPFMATRLAPDEQPEHSFADLEPGGGKDAGEEHQAALEMALSAAESEALAGNYGMALRWLTVAERLELVLPPEYAERREQWRHALRAGSGD